MNGEVTELVNFFPVFGKRFEHVEPMSGERMNKIMYEWEMEDRRH